jgi:hypothetical protein
MPEEIVRNPERVARFWLTNADATPSELRLREMKRVFPGLPKRNPGLELANAFSVIHFLIHPFSKVGSISTFCAKPLPGAAGRQVCFLNEGLEKASAR